MDPEKNSNNSSFEDLSNINESELKEHQQHDEDEDRKEEDDIIDVLGNGQLKKRVILFYSYNFLLHSCSYDSSQVLIKGKPDTQPQRHDLCTINLLGKLENGTVVEDEKVITVQVGDVEVR